MTAARIAALRDGARWGRQIARAEIVGPTAAYALWWRREQAVCRHAPHNRQAWRVAYDRGYRRARRQAYQEAMP